jgi:hypothetical protein
MPLEEIQFKFSSKGWEMEFEIMQRHFILSNSTFSKYLMSNIIMFAAKKALMLLYLD